MKKYVWLIVLVAFILLIPNNVFAAFEWCENNPTTGYSGLVKTIGIGIAVINVIRIGAVIGLIGFTIYDAVKVVFNPDEQKNFGKKAVNRLIYAAVIFILPMLINLLLNSISGIDGAEVGDSQLKDTNDCWKLATDYYNSTFGG